MSKWPLGLWIAGALILTAELLFKVSAYYHLIDTDNRLLIEIPYIGGLETTLFINKYSAFR